MSSISGIQGLPLEITGKISSLLIVVLKARTILIYFRMGRCNLCVVWLLVVGCLNLKDKEWISRQDPYVCVEYAATRFRTRTCTGTKLYKCMVEFPWIYIHILQMEVKTLLSKRSLLSTSLKVCQRLMSSFGTATHFPLMISSAVAGTYAFPSQNDIFK